MNRVCPSCGLDQLSEQIDWCPRCNEFLAWDRNGVTADSSGEGATVAVPTIAPPAQATGTRGRVVLRLKGPGEETTSDLPVQLSVEAGHTVSLIALVRNESEIVEHFRLGVDGLPDGWWSVEREVVRLMSFGSDEYETELAVSIHPPRTAHARAGRYEFEVVASAVAQPLEARATAWVDVLPFQADRARRTPAGGRRPAARALLRRRATTSATHPFAVDVGASELEDRCRFVLPGRRAPASCRPRPPRSRSSSGRASRSSSGARPTGCSSCGRGRPTTSPTPPSSASATYRQRPWIPWWLALLVLLLVIAAVLVFLLWPDRVTVPDVEGEPSAFAAQERLEQDGLTVSPESKNEVRSRRRAGNRHRPDAGRGQRGRPRDRGHAAARPGRPRDARAGREGADSERGRPAARLRRTSRSGTSLRSSIRRERSPARSRCRAGFAGGARPSTSSSPARR